MSASNDIRRKLYTLRQKSAEKYLELTGANVKALRSFDKELGDQVSALADEIGRGLKDVGTAVPKQHEVLLARERRRLTKEAEAALSRAWPPGLTLRPIPWCFCLYNAQATPVGQGSDPAVLVPPDDEHTTADVTFEATGNVAHPRVETRGNGIGSLTSSRLVTWFRFAFTPLTDGAYCIKPFTQMNGHWLAWTWSTCPPGTQGNGRVEVKLRVQVDQLSVPVSTREHVVVHQVVSEGVDHASGFAYDSSTDRGAETGAYLEGGHEAVVWVKADCYAEIEHRGAGWVDMKSSPQFYFKVPEVWWGPKLCFPWF